MKRIITATALGMGISLAHATPLYHPPGPNLTYGAVSNGQTIMSDITNPAAGAAALKKDGNQYRFGILSSIGAGAEFGKIDDLYDKIDAQANAFSTGVGVDPLDFTGTINTQVNTVNSVLSEVASPDAYAKGFVSGHVPLMPIVVAHKALGGSIVLDINASVAAKVHALHTDVIIDAAQLETDILGGGPGVYTNGDVTIDATTASPVLTINNDSSVIAKASSTAELAVGYSRPVVEIGGGTVYGGLRGRYHKVGLARAAIRLGSLIDGAEQAFDDATDEDFVTDTAFGLDVGVLWVNDHFRVGATLANLNQPEFDFGDITKVTDGTYTNAGIISQIRESNTYTLEKQLTVETAIYTKSQNWVISAAMDANAIEDALGDEYQWGTISAAYATDTWFLPGIRAGLRQNLAGTKVKYLTGGVTMGPVNLDVAYSPDSVTIDGNTVPRGAIVNLGLEVSF